MPTFRLTLRYDGTDFVGSQTQPGKRTVQGELERALSRLGGETRATFAGRTDRGVHAYGQVAAVRLPHWTATAQDLVRSLNKLVPADLAVVDAAVSEEGFNPRFAATWREYRYFVAPGVASPFLSRYAWTPRKALDMSAMAIAADKLVGRHDFASFASGGEGVPWSDRANAARGTTRTIFGCDIDRVRILDGPLSGEPVEGLGIRVIADGFLPKMVRNIVGALAEVGGGERDPAWIDELLLVRDRRFGPEAAPAHGLTLWRVGFADLPEDIDRKRRRDRSASKGAR